jgi:hypothetical protein
VKQARCSSGGVISHGVDRLTGLLVELRVQRQHLPQQGIRRIPRPHPGQEAAGHHQPEQFRRPAGRRQKVFGQPQRLDQCVRIADRAGERLVPVRLNNDF